VLVDAVVGGGEPGSVLHLAAEAIASNPSPMPLSSHGIGVAEALELARTLYRTPIATRVEIVGVVIARPTGPGFGLSPAVAAAVEPAAALAAALAGAL
jgi:hydrogenase maturation protease